MSHVYENFLTTRLCNMLEEIFITRLLHLRLKDHLIFLFIINLLELYLYMKTVKYTKETKEYLLLSIILILRIRNRTLS